MTVSPLPTIERRRRRSDQTLTALTYQLEHIFKNEGLRNFTLANMSGLVVASAGDPLESEVLAAYAPLLARSVERRFRHQVIARIQKLIPDMSAESLHIRQFTVDGEPLFLTLAGKPGVYRDVGLYRAVTGVRRILD